MIGDVEFDHIAPIYDETRRAPTKEELETLVGLLFGCRTVLDAGVGTGRYASPLRDQQFEIIGVDLSMEMMRRAYGKGIGSLVRADIRRLPFPDGAVDATFMAHVLQLVPDPRVVLGELGRVARRAVVVQLPQWTERAPTSAWREFRKRYRELAAELGHPLPERGQRYRHTLEELRAIATPTAVRDVSGPSLSGLTPEERLAWWESRAFVGSHLPADVHAEILRRLHAERLAGPLGEARSRVVHFVAWDPMDLRTVV